MKHKSKPPLTDDQQAWLDETPLGESRSIERYGVKFTVYRRIPGNAWGVELPVHNLEMTDSKYILYPKHPLEIRKS